ncbi:hypothetical protein [Mesonia maritima]|uniref:Uncharacterized protein n=1 Tax=Mesonia maritima TaxID=1793873 RepID=A0ABU1K4S8_9FLAO|nr:hypothetical protein [Mesonia maritima]MDR6300615.1 hypothetical protein [Mesonia maritima]
MEKPILTDNVNRKKYLKDIGIDIDNISDDIRNLYKKKLELATNDIKHGKFIANLTFKEVLLLQAVEKEEMIKFETKSKDPYIEGYSTALWSSRLDNQILTSMKFLIAP